MAKRSDFAQKLLDDLRLRKERMSASQSSKTAQPMAGDAYSHARKAQRGSRDMKLHQNTNLKSGRTHNRSTGGSKSLTIRESSHSQDIVPLGRGQNSEQFRDLSMALAFALDGGKVTRTNSSDTSLMLRFLNQISGRSVKTNKKERNNIVMHNRSTNHMPSISHLQINEIAKGAQKLNQILRAFSNGMNLDGYSIEIGNELLKGAMNLEESLRMLVNFQENSDYVIGSQNKARITLLEDDEDDNYDTITVENKQLAQPVFSFDKSSRSSQHIQELYERLISQSYQPDNLNYSSNRKTSGTSNSASQRKSASNSSSMRASVGFSEQKNQSSSTKSKPEKGRIPSVIAKLMGLEELPESDEAKHIIKKEPTLKEKTERIEVKKNEGNNAQIRRHKQAQPDRVQLTQDSHHLQEKRDLASHRKSFDGTIHSTKPPQKDVDGTKMSGRLKKATERHENNTGHTGNRKNIRGKEGKMDSANLKEQKGREKAGAKESILKHELQKMTSRTDKVSGTETAALQELAKGNITMPTERRNEHVQPLNSLTKSPFYLATQQPEAREMQHHEVEVDQWSKKQDAQVTAKLQSENMSSPTFMQRYLYSTKTTARTGGSILTNTGRQEDAVQNRSALNSNTKMQESVNKNSIQNSSLRNFSSEVMKERNRNSMATKAEEKIVHNVQVKNEQKVVAPRNVDELVSRRRNLHKLAGTSQHQPPVLQEVKQRRHKTLNQFNEDNQGTLSRSAELEARILKSNTAKPNGLGELQIQAEQGSSFCTLRDNNESQNPKSLKIVAQDSHGIAKLATVVNNQQRQRDNKKLQSLKTGSGPFNRISAGGKDATHSQPHKRYEPIIKTPEPLTESENNLLQILVKSQLFLEASAALFRLNVPLSALDANSEDRHSDGNNLMLDCGYEVMKRKGRRIEINRHPYTKFHITSPKIRHLNDLIKQLHKDLEKLKFYGRNEKIGSTVEDYLPKMLEIDVYDKDPDVNCMWDYGWHKMMFMSLEKEDVIKDLEKHVLNGLLDELTMDLVVF